MPERGFSTSFWTDPFVVKLPQEAKTLFTYLFTNDHCNQAGLYEIALETIASETKIPEDALPGLLSLLEPKVKWYPEQSLVWIKNFLRRQAKSPKFIVSALKALDNHRIPEDIRGDFEFYNQELLRGVTPSDHISLTKRECVLIRDDFHCQYCSKEIVQEADYEMDHIIPIIKGGRDNYLNLVASCRSCNQQKLDKTPVQVGLPEPTPSNFHGAQAAYILRNNPSAREKWLKIFPERAAVADRILGNVDSILNNIDQYHSRIPSSASASASANASADKGEGRGSSATDKNLAAIVKVYEENIGVITPIAAEKLKDIAEKHPVEWFKDAVSEAVKANVRKLSYVEAILERWAVQGKGTLKARGRPGKELETGKELEEGWKPQKPKR
jgi:DnaD/phage-associated family protein